MSGQQLQTVAFVLTKQPSGSDTFEQLNSFSAEHGVLHCLQRLARSKTGITPVDLFDEVELWLESSNQGRTWFIKEHRLLQRHEGIGRSYEALRAGASITSLISRNAVPDESRDAIFDLLRSSLDALAAGGRPDIIWLKALYRFLRDEGYPVKQQWWPALNPESREIAAQLINQPLFKQTTSAASVAKIVLQLEQWVGAETEIRLR